jgi:hypothetical protein
LFRDNVLVANGGSQRSPTADGQNTWSEGVHYVTEDETGGTYFIATYSSASKSGDGQGEGVSIVSTELFAYVDIWRRESAG